MTGAPIFLYGTPLDGRTLARRSGDARLVLRSTPAVLLGFRRLGLRGTPCPTLRRDSCAALSGELIRPSTAAMRRLASYEGGAYRLHPVRVLTPRGPRKARAWLAAPWRAGANPWPA
ncbi:MAG: gamma-glutamylcyclotransferase family protein [Pseudomonadota bacterium]